MAKASFAFGFVSLPYVKRIGKIENIKFPKYLMSHEHGQNVCLSEHTQQIL